MTWETLYQANLTAQQATDYPQAYEPIPPQSLPGVHYDRSLIVTANSATARPNWNLGGYLICKESRQGFANLVNTRRMPIYLNQTIELRDLPESYELELQVGDWLRDLSVEISRAIRPIPPVANCIAFDWRDCTKNEWVSFNAPSNVLIGEMDVTGQAVEAHSDSFGVFQDGFPSIQSFAYFGRWNNIRQVNLILTHSSSGLYNNELYCGFRSFGSPAAATAFNNATQILEGIESTPLVDTDRPEGFYPHVIRLTGAISPDAIGRGAGGRHACNSVKELILSEQAWTPVEAQQVADYLQAKWGA